MILIIFNCILYLTEPTGKPVGFYWWSSSPCVHSEGFGKDIYSRAVETWEQPYGHILHYQANETS